MSKEVLQSNTAFMSYLEYKKSREKAAKAKHDATFKRNKNVDIDYFVIEEYGIKFSVISFLSLDEIAAQPFHPDLHFPELGVETFDMPRHYAILYPNGYWERGVYVYEQDPEMIGFEEFVYRKVTNSAFLLNYIIDQNKSKTK